MAAIIHCDPIIGHRLTEGYGSGRSEYSEAWPRGSWSGAQAQVTLLIDENGNVRWLGSARGAGIITTLQQRVKITRIEPIEPVSLDDLRDALPAKFQYVVDRTGVLPDGSGRALIEALSEASGNAATIIHRLQHSSHLDIPDDEAGDLLLQERDGLGLLLDVANIDRAARDYWSPVADGVPFLTGIDQVATIEDHLVIHDVETFSDWIQLPLAHVAWRAFAKDYRRLYVMNANRTPVERTLGVDVVYYHQEQQSFVLVQYKKLSRDSRSNSSEPTYRPDVNLDSELERMERIDELCARAAGDYRLSKTPCWVKLCEASHRQAQTSRLIPGMYLPREYFVELKENLKGPRGGTVFTWQNVPRHVSNTMFVDLIQGGWIGSTGTATDEIKRLVRESIETGHAVVLGIDVTAEASANTGQPAMSGSDPSLPF